MISIKNYWRQFFRCAASPKFCADKRRRPCWWSLWILLSKQARLLPTYCVGGGVVWPDLTRFRHFCKILQVFGKFLVVYLLFGKLLSLLLANLLHYWTIFYQGKWPNIEKQSNHLVTLVGDQVSLHCIFCAFTYLGSEIPFHCNIFIL